MKSLIVNTFQCEGGAARAAFRLHQGLRNHGVDSRMFVQYGDDSDPYVMAPCRWYEQLFNKARPFIDALPLFLYRPRLSPPWGLAWLPKKIDFRLADFNPDILHLHWTCFGFLPIERLCCLGKPIVWTLHDSWAFTGGCHIPFDCRRYQDACGLCPQLHSRSENDLSRWVWKRKKKAFQGVEIVIVTPSNWLAICARRSSLFKGVNVEVIPNGVDVDLYQPLEQNALREALGVSDGKLLILYGAFGFDRDKNKGFDLFRDALHLLVSRGWEEKAEVVVFGVDNGVELPDLGLKTHSIGVLNDESKLIEVYSSADIFVLSSMMENLPNTVMEAMACGVPCAAFNVGGVPDLIDHQQNGCLANPFSVKELAESIEWILSDENKRRQLSEHARQKIVNEFSVECTVAKYLSLYHRVNSIDRMAEGDAH